MEKRIFLKAGMKRHKRSLLGICILVFLAVLSLSSVLTVWLGGSAYLEKELQKAGYGELTAWVSHVPDLELLTAGIESQAEVAEANPQRLIFADYEANGIESDSEGQLIPWNSLDDRYRFLNGELSGYQAAPEEIRPGEIYVSASMVSVMGLETGDSVSFQIARKGMTKEFTVSGYYEDPFMGSSMIGMKGFLISEADYREITDVIEAEGMDALAREGAMIHIQAAEGTVFSAEELNSLLNETTPLSQYAEFVYSAYTIESFMMILQNAFCALAAAFALVLLAAAAVVLGHSISGLIEQDRKNLGILKTAGFTGSQLISIQMAQYLAAVCVGELLGIALASPFAGLLSRLIVTTTGFLIPARLVFLPCAGLFLGVLFLLAGFTAWRLQKVMKITPMDAVRGEETGAGTGPQFGKLPGIRMEGLAFYLALRQLLKGKKRYLGACMVAALLVFSASLTGRMNDWLGPDGQGMMDAFNPADLDLGVQALGELHMEEAEELVRSYSGITDSYLLAMPDVSIQGAGFTANVITEPERFHISRGRTCLEADEVVLTEAAAADLGVDIGDSVTIRGDMGTGEFTVSGIYHCANDMGANLGMNREGWLSIGQDAPRLWCHHYFLEDPSQKEAITLALEEAYGGDIHVHENSWPGLSGIISAMHLLLMFLYGMTAVFILIVTGMTGSRILNAEQKDLTILRAVGCTSGMLRISFGLRFGLAVLPGVILGTVCAALFTDPLVSSVMRLAGISNFASSLSAGSALFPGIVVVVLFFLSAWTSSGKIRRLDMGMLAEE